MAEVNELRATPRTVIGKKVKRLRNEGIIPGVIYGHGIGSVAVQFDSRELEKTLSEAGTSTTVQVYIEGTEEPYLTIFRDVQYHPLRRNVEHIDLQALSLTEKVRVPVSVVLEGISPAIAEEGGVMLQILTELEIEALPTALVPSITVDVSHMTEVGQTFTVADLDVPEGIAILHALDETIAQVSWQEVEELEEPVEEELAYEVPLVGEEEAAEEGLEEEEEEE